MCGSVEPLNLCNANVVFSLQNLDQKSISISKLRPKIKINIHIYIYIYIKAETLRRSA